MLVVSGKRRKDRGIYPKGQADREDHHPGQGNDPQHQVPVRQGGNHYSLGRFLGGRMTLRKFNRIHRGVRPRVMSHHHLLARCRGGTNDKNNLVRWWADKHQAYNSFFGSDRTLDEAIDFLMRLKSAYHL